MHPDERIYTFWDYFRNAYARDAGLRIDHLLLNPAIAGRLEAAEVDRQFAVGTRRAITPPPGSSLPMASPRPSAPKPRGCEQRSMHPERCRSEARA
jgi:hypothetical protein